MNVCDGEGRRAEKMPRTMLILSRRAHTVQRKSSGRSLPKQGVPATSLTFVTITPRKVPGPPNVSKSSKSNPYLCWFSRIQQTCWREGREDPLPAVLCLAEFHSNETSRGGTGFLADFFPVLIGDTHKKKTRNPGKTFSGVHILWTLNFFFYPVSRAHRFFNKKTNRQFFPRKSFWKGKKWLWVGFAKHRSNHLNFLSSGFVVKMRWKNKLQAGEKNGRPIQLKAWVCGCNDQDAGEGRGTKWSVIWETPPLYLVIRKAPRNMHCDNFRKSHKG